MSALGNYCPHPTPAASALPGDLPQAQGLSFQLPEESQTESSFPYYFTIKPCPKIGDKSCATGGLSLGPAAQCCVGTSL